MPAEPAAKADELWNRLAAVMGQPVPDEKELRRIERGASRLMRSDAASADGLLGFAAALRGHADAVRDHFRIVLQQDASADAWLNYAVSLALVELHGEALEIATTAFDHYPDDLRLLERAITSALEFADFTTGRDLVDRWSTLLPAQPHPLAQVSRQLAAAIEAGAFGEAGVRAVLQIVSESQREERVRACKTAITADEFRWSFLYQRFVYAPPSVAAALNERIAHRITARSDLMADPGLRFVPAFTGIADGRHA